MFYPWCVQFIAVAFIVIAITTRIAMVHPLPVFFKGDAKLLRWAISEPSCAAATAGIETDRRVLAVKPGRTWPHYSAAIRASIHAILSS